MPLSNEDRLTAEFSRTASALLKHERSGGRRDKHRLALLQLVAEHLQKMEEARSSASGSQIGGVMRPIGDFSPGTYVQDGDPSDVLPESTPPADPDAS